MDTIQTTVGKLLSDTDPSERRFAAEELATAEGFAPIAALAAALRDENKGVRDASKRSLEQIGNENVARAVVEYLADRNIITRNLAADILLKLKDNSVQALLPYLYDADQDVRKFAVDILGGIGSEEAITHLINALNDVDSNVVVSAAEALGNIKAVRAVPELIQLFQRSGEARSIVTEALGKIGGSHAEDFLAQQVQEILNSPEKDFLLLFTVFESLGMIGTESSVQLIDSVIPQLSKKLMMIALYALLKIQLQNSLSTKFEDKYLVEVIHMLKDDNVQARIVAIHVLVKKSGKPITKELLSILGRNSEVDAQLLPLLASRPLVMNEALDILYEEKIVPNSVCISFIRSVIDSLYLNFPPPGQLDVLLEKVMYVFDSIAGTWGNADNESKYVIVDTLFKLNSEKATEFFTALSSDPDPWVRMQLIEVLATVEHVHALECIEKFEHDEDESVQELAVATLSNRRMNYSENE